MERDHGRLLVVIVACFIRGMVKRGLDTFGEFALFSNQDLDAVARRRQGRGQALRRHADMVCEALQGCLPRRQLTAEMLLPEGGELKIDAGFVGVLGAFEIYRGCVGGHRMAKSVDPEKLNVSGGKVVGWMLEMVERLS
jgi:hypothetical protein